MAYNGKEYRYGRNDAEEEVDDVEEDEDIRSSNDHCIVLIDARTNMSEPMDVSGTGMVSDSLQSTISFRVPYPLNPYGPGFQVLY